MMFVLKEKKFGQDAIYQTVVYGGVEKLARILSNPSERYYVIQGKGHFFNYVEIYDHGRQIGEYDGYHNKLVLPEYLRRKLDEKVRE